MSVNIEFYKEVTTYLQLNKVQLIAVSKTKPNEAILDLHQLGQKDFGENYVQELVDKAAALPQDIQWHFIGHLQSNKVKYIAPFVYLIHGVDSEKLLIEINKQAQKNNRIIDVLLQVHIASEETKFGFDELTLLELIQSGRLTNYSNIRLCGLMGMASFSDDTVLIQNEFSSLKHTYNIAEALLNTSYFDQLSMGMSSDYKLAIEYGSTMVRIGSLLFGARVYNK
ncbi:MAG: YggS family pyridoxal phosphate-dependent enzyme [Sediminibacterium sp.]|jgi:PLP dependent protein|nr:YggS family pyridoxal phosphate-dependent enzyme [Sediminibacterium sp.]